MKYRDGADVRLWDRVEAYGDADGIVLGSAESNEYAPELRDPYWCGLGGILFVTKDMGLVQVSDEFECMRLIRRGGPPSEEEWRPFQAALDAMGGGPIVQ